MYCHKKSSGISIINLHTPVSFCSNAEPMRDWPLVKLYGEQFTSGSSLSSINKVSFGFQNKRCHGPLNDVPYFKNSLELIERAQPI